MAKSCPTLIALFCFFTLSLASHAPLDNDEASTQVAILNPNEPVNSEKQFTSFDVSSATLTKIPFRVVNRRFSSRPKLPCRHHRKVRPTVTNYGDDMIFPTGENSDFEAPVVYGGGRRASGEWLRLHHHRRHQDHGEDSGSDDDDADGRIKKAAFKRHVYGRFDFRVLKKLKKHFGEGVMKKKMKKDGFMRRARKFLDQYF